MNILDKANYKVIKRGHQYYVDECIIDSTQNNIFEFEGIVQGSENYHVKINIKNPEQSTCDCPYAQDHMICKHMIALYFYNFPKEADDYFYNETDDWYDEDDFNCHRTYFNKPFYYNDMLMKYIDSLSKNELKNIVFKELNKNDEYTYNHYLKQYENEYKNQTNSDIFFISDLAYKLENKQNVRNYDYHNYDEELLTSLEKFKIQNLYEKYSDKLDDILLNTQLSIYNDYQWVINFYKSKLSKEKIHIFKTKLLNLFENYKHRGIRNTACKSNILIAIEILCESDIKELALSLIRNSKYTEYIDYIFLNKKITKELFDEINKIVNSNLSKYKHYSVDLYKRFLELFPSDKNIKNEYVYIHFMSKGNPLILSSIENKDDFNGIINRILSNAKKDYTLTKLYIYLERFDDLYEMLINNDDSFSLCNYVLYFKDKYSDELEVYFTEKFLNKLETGMKREIYKEACKYIKAINKLEKGSQRVEKIRLNLLNSDYRNRRALFEEINNAIK